MTLLCDSANSKNLEYRCRFQPQQTHHHHQQYILTPFIITFYTFPTMQVQRPLSSVSCSRMLGTNVASTNWTTGRPRCQLACVEFCATSISPFYERAECNEITCGRGASCESALDSKIEVFQFISGWWSGCSPGSTLFSLQSSAGYHACRQQTLSPAWICCSQRRLCWPPFVDANEWAKIGKHLGFRRNSPPTSSSMTLPLSIMRLIPYKAPLQHILEILTLFMSTSPQCKLVCLVLIRCFRVWLFVFPPFFLCVCVCMCVCESVADVNVVC